MRIVVTGAGGFLGRAVLPLLGDHQVIAVDPDAALRRAALGFVHDGSLEALVENVLAAVAGEEAHEACNT